MNPKCPSTAARPFHVDARGVRRRTLLCLAIGAALGGPAPAAVAMAVAAPVGSAGPPDASADAGGSSVGFDPSFLSGGGRNVDISRFERGNAVPPGVYNADVFLNGNWVGRRDLHIALPAGATSAVPCLDQDLFDQLGLRAVKLAAPAPVDLHDPSVCTGLASLIPGASMDFDLSELRLDVSVPQAYMNQAARGYVDPKYWDAGVPAALLDYNVNAYRSTSGGYSMNSVYLGLNSGFNAGLWRFRQSSTATATSGFNGPSSSTRWQSIQTYVQRDIPSWTAQLTLGDSYTDGQVYDSFAIRGVQLATDDRMRPDSMSGYAPVVQGVAQTNARVTISQNGIKLYETTVAPGPFSINDLYPTGYGGDLLVTVTEANGISHSFTVPYAAIPQLLRPGITRFSISAGQLRGLSIGHEPTVAQLTLQHGFNNLLTGYAGASAFDGYGNLLAGMAVNTALGALSMDAAASRTALPGASTQSGHSFRLTFSKIIPATQTSFTVAAYRYSTSGYLDITNAAIARDYMRRGLDAYTTVLPPDQLGIDGVTTSSMLTPAQLAALGGTAYNPAALATVLTRQRNRFALTMNQALGSYGSVYVNATTVSYWDRSHTTQYQVGYSSSFKRVNYAVSMLRARDQWGRLDNQVMLNVSLPLGDGPHAASFNTALTHDDTTGTQEQATVNGSWGEDGQFSYGATASHSSGESGAGSSGSLNGGYRSPVAVLGASVGAGNGYSQASATISGSMVAYPGGVLFGQSLGDASAIVYVPGADGARIGNASGVRVGSSGYALVPYLRPFVLNTITIDPKGLPLDVQLDSTSAQVAPHAGAITLVKFKTQEGRSAVMHVTQPDGHPVPFGAEVFDASDLSLGIVGQAGTVLVRGVKPAGTLNVRWQDSKGQSITCSLHYALPPRHKGDDALYEAIPATCSPVTTGVKP